MTKLFRKIISIMLVVCMIFTSQAFVTFAEGMENTEAIVKETTIEETTVKETEETIVETTVKETIIGENSKDSANNELISPDVDEKEESTETEYAEEPEKDEIETETRMGEPEDKETIIGENSEDSANNELISPDADEKEESTETEYAEEPGEDVEETTAAEEVEVDTSEDKKIYNEIYGDDDRMLDRISEVVPPPVKNYYVGDKYDLTGYEITAWYDDDSFENIVYADHKDRFTFDPDYVNNPFTASTPEGEPVEMEITYTDTEGRSASYTKAIQVHPAPAPTTYIVTYNQNLPSGYTLSDGKTWYADETFPNAEDIYTELEGWYDMTCEDADGNIRILLKWNTKADGTGTDYNFGDEIADATHFTEYKLILYAVWGKAYTLSYNQNLPEGYNLSEGKIWCEDETFPNAESIYTELNGSEDMTCEDANGITRKLLKWNTKADGTGTDYAFAQEITDESLFTDHEFILYAVWSKVYTLSYNQNLPEGYNLSEGKTWYSDEIFSDAEYIYTELNGSEDMTCEDADGITRKLLKWNTKADGTGTDYNFVQEITGESHFTDHEFILYAVWSKVYTLSYNQNLPTGYTLSGGMTWYTDSATTDLTGNPIILKGSADMTCEDTSGNTRTLQSWNTQIELKGNTFNFGDTFNDPQYFDPDPTCTLYAVWSDPVGPTPTTYTIKYDKNLPSGYTISTSKTWYTDSTSDDLSSNPIKISGSADMTCENADGYVRKLEAWNTLADKSGTPYMFAENIDSPSAFTSNPLTLYAVWGDPVVPTPGTDKFYIISYGNPTEYPNEKKIFAFDSTTTVEEMENFVANNISKCINPSGKAANGFYDMSELIPVGADDTQVRQILNDNYDLTKEKIRTLDKIAVWFEDYIPDPMGVYLGITFEGSTPAKTVTKIAIKTNPTKTTYDSGDAFDPTGLVISVTYDDSTKADIDYDSHKSDFSFDPTTITASGDVVVTYGGKTASIAVTVSEEPTPETEVSSIKILTNPTKTSYTVGDKLNPAGLRIEVTYSNGDIEEVPYNDGTKDKFSFIPSLSANLNIAHKSIKITYGKKSTSFNITVSPKYNPEPYNPGGGGGSSGGSSSDPTHGPMGDLTKNPAYQNLFNGQINQNLNNVNAIPQNKLINNTALINTLKAYPENANAAKTNAKDINGNTGFGQWQRVPGTTTWYFLSGDLNSNGTTGTVGFLSNGWYNLGWDGQDKWYHFDANGVMQLGWYQEDEKIYYLQNDFTDNWYGKAVTGQQMIDGITYTFDSNGALIR